MEQTEMNELETIAIIPARGGSKRIPGKNIKPFLGKPIIQYVIENLKKSELFNRIIISTDDAEIANLGRSLGIEVPFLRSFENSSDMATTFSVLQEVADQLKAEAIRFKYACCIYPTSVFSDAELLQESYGKFRQMNCMTLFSTVKFSYPPQRGLIIDGNRVKLLNPEYVNSRSQDLEPIYHDAGQFYWFKYETLIQCESLFTADTSNFDIPEDSVQDIDNLSDWNLAEMKYKLKGL